MKRYKHSLSNYKLLTAHMGKLIPVNIAEVLPGDTIQQATNAFVRISPMNAPIMHPVKIRFHHWYVPNRILDPNWEDFIVNGTGTLPRIVLDSSTTAKGSLADYFGIKPLSSGQDKTVLSYPFLAYNKIFNTFYRDQDLQAEVADDSTVLQNVSWEKDYFTTARPWEQKGTQVSIPFARLPSYRVAEDGDFTLVGSGANYRNFYFNSSIGWSSTQNSFVDNVPHKYSHGLKIEPETIGPKAALSVSDLRLSLALQRYQEARAMYGSRYVEYLRYLGVKSSDARLQLPEYLGGGSSMLQISEVLQTAEGTDPVGTMRGHGVSSMATRRYRRYFEEHGFVITLMSVVPKTVYADGIERFWTKSIKEDFFQKELANLGMEPIYKQEVYSDGSADDSEVFGYQDRYSDYKQIAPKIAGDFRDTLSHWHLARLFSTHPSLNADFIKCNPSMRVFADTVSPPLLFMIQNSIQARRIVPRINKPKTF